MGRKSVLVACSALVGLAMSMTATAATDDTTSIIAALKAQIEALAARVETLEATEETSKHTSIKSAKSIRSTAVVAAPVTQPTPIVQPSTSSWTDDISLKGDFRYRHEAFDVDNRRDRHRQRVRARTQVTGRVNDTTSVGFGLASGGSNPISSNQTLDDAGSTKDIGIDLAYVKWQPTDSTTILAGKIKNPIHRVGGNSLLWDGDLNPEGVGVQYQSGSFFANGIASWLDESGSDDDSYLVGGQVGLNSDAGPGVLKVGIGYFNFLDTRGETPFFNGSPSGNRIDANGQYMSGFEILEGFAEFGFDAGDGELSIFADFVQNLDASAYDMGYALGGTYRINKWRFGYTYQELEADAVLATLTDSDFIGGGTDGEGHILRSSYALSQNVNLSGTLFLNDRNIDFGNEEQYKRLMLDISFKY
ncbi:MAG: hypothetical protein GKR90_05300 [Pseudomonadales bacterium]|nr:hypothetical protein [Pseudomonadales bacterium]